MRNRTNAVKNPGVETLHVVTNGVYLPGVGALLRWNTYRIRATCRGTTHQIRKGNLTRVQPAAAADQARM
jgi:hypothetical protein